MQYYSTRRQSPDVTLSQAVVKGLAPDRGLYMPRRIPVLPRGFFDRLPGMPLADAAVTAAMALFGEDIEPARLEAMTRETLDFDIPLVHVDGDIYALELFHGPTLAFKDVGARFMARMLAYFGQRNSGETVNVLVATSGDTGSAVANGFLGVDGVRVFVLYPKGKVSPIQEAQFTTLGRNITAIEVDGTFDDCQALVKQAFLDPELNEAMQLTSANSINVARFLPQMFYYFHAWGQAVAQGADPSQVVICVPSGNFGNITAGLIAKRMGLPVKRFIAANNANGIFCDYLSTGLYQPRKSVQTIANAMDVGDPSNYARVLDLYGSDHAAICREITGFSYSDDEIADTLRDTAQRSGYVADPHGAAGLRALQQNLKPGETGIFLETAHPAKFKDTVEGITGQPVAVPERLAAFMRGTKQSVPVTADFTAFKTLLFK